MLVGVCPDGIVSFFTNIEKHLYIYIIWQYWMTVLPPLPPRKRSTRKNEKVFLPYLWQKFCMGKTFNERWKLYLYLLEEVRLDGYQSLRNLLQLKLDHFNTLCPFYQISIGTICLKILFIKNIRYLIFVGITCSN